MSEPTHPPPTEAVNAELLDKDATTKSTEAQGVPATEADIPVNGETSLTTEGVESGALTDSEPKDTHMSDVPASEQPESAALSGLTAGAATASSANAANSSSNAPSPTPALARVGGAGLEGDRTTSRAASANPETGPSFTMPSEAPAHGAPVRQYINQKVTSVLMQGMKLIAKEQPSDPLRVLGEFLLQRSKELEGPAAAAS
ncbi:hypothetical protein QBC37DRAFT_374529 [Rhypophila decipiens]|uniref:Uncharacterized protein n=1 Tax=Rhypophila decipiens TaxID=261697 RepID=A0AAN7B7J0_9PEZI|nr:hypothetical protein QBC37DRAFT_374529 [Rhypophila decipiens]